jgi:hypothetical protein
MNTHFLGVLKALDTITEGGADYQKEYKNYIINHKRRVTQFADWLKKNLPELFEEPGLEDFDAVIAEHDESKFTEPEFEPYARFWFNDDEHYDYDPEYEAAWEHHWMNNEHHPEYWNGNDMPYIYILEMICDWGSFGVQKGDYKELISFYYNKARDDEEKNLSENTKKIIEEILSKIEEVD